MPSCVVGVLDAGTRLGQVVHLGTRHNGTRVWLDWAAAAAVPGGRHAPATLRLPLLPAEQFLDSWALTKSLPFLRMFPNGNLPYWGESIS